VISSTSNQPLGDGTVLVCYTARGLEVDIDGAYVGGADKMVYVGIWELSVSRVALWRKAIADELASDAVDAERADEEARKDAILDRRLEFAL
jgi:hypothetical protein